MALFQAADDGVRRMRLYGHREDLGAYQDDREDEGGHSRHEDDVKDVQPSSARRPADDGQNDQAEYVVDHRRPDNYA